MMLYEVMKHIRNFFPTDISEEREFEIKDGTLSLSFVSDNRYVLIEGSTMNDGVYKYPIEGLEDEVFEGRVTILCPPRNFIDLVSEIEAFKSSLNLGGYQSESFGGYSYSRATNSSGSLADWQDVYRERLNVWRKI